MSDACKGPDGALAELVERLSSATGPDRELDLAIALATGWQSRTQNDPITGPENVLTDGRSTIFMPRRYTSSLDAALTLVPEGWLWDADRYVDTCDWRLDRNGLRTRGQHSHTAIALVTAALKARLALLRAAAPTPKANEREEN